MYFITYKICNLAIFMFMYTSVTAADVTPQSRNPLRCYDVIRRKKQLHKSYVLATYKTSGRFEQNQVQP
jgi:hypothetical protein